MRDNKTLPECDPESVGKRCMHAAVVVLTDGQEMLLASYAIDATVLGWRCTRRRSRRKTLQRPSLLSLSTWTTYAFVGQAYLNLGSG